MIDSLSHSKMVIESFVTSLQVFYGYSFQLKLKIILMEWNTIRYMLRNSRSLRQSPKQNIEQKDLATGMHLKAPILLHSDHLDFQVSQITHCMLLNDFKYLNGGQEYCQLTGENGQCAMQCGLQFLQIIELISTENELGITRT